MGHLAPFKLAQGGTALGGGCYWESRPSCRTRSLKYLPEQMRADESTLTSAARAADSRPQVRQAGRRAAGQGKVVGKKCTHPLAAGGAALRASCGARCSCSRCSRCPGVEPGSWHLRFRGASVRAYLTGWMWMGHLAPSKLAQGGTAPGGGCYWESRPSCRTRSLKYLPEQMCADESTLTYATRSPRDET